MTEHDIPLSPLPYGDRSWMNDWIPSQVFPEADGIRIYVSWNRRIGPYRVERIGPDGVVLESWSIPYD